MPHLTNPREVLTATRLLNRAIIAGEGQKHTVRHEIASLGKSQRSTWNNWRKGVRKLGSDKWQENGLTAGELRIAFFGASSSVKLGGGIEITYYMFDPGLIAICGSEEEVIRQSGLTALQSAPESLEAMLIGSDSEKMKSEQFEKAINQVQSEFIPPDLAANRMRFEFEKGLIDGSVENSEANLALFAEFDEAISRNELGEELLNRVRKVIN